MSLPGTSRVRGATLGDMLIFVSVLAMVAALLYPAWKARSSRQRLAQAVSDVDAVSRAARSVRESTGRWPEGAPTGTVPPDFAVLAAQDSVFSRGDYALGWSVWNLVDSVPAPPDAGPASADAPPDSAKPRMLPVVHEVGAVSVASGDSTLLMELSEHYVDAAPLLLDTLWLMVLPERSPAQARRR
jgi:type II secretory pathway pseudopilin PulG